MRKITRIIFIGLCCIFSRRSSSYAQQPKYLFGITFPKTYNTIKLPTPPVTPKDEWKLIFEDNFDSIKPNTDKWYFTPPWGNVFLFGSKDRCDSNQNGISERSDPKNLELSDGTIKLKVCKQESYTYSLNYQPDTFMEPDGIANKRAFRYSAGTLFSKQKFGPGKFEIRCKIPKVDGVWPAFWLYGECGQEFDCFEFLNETYKDPTPVCNKKIHMTYHRNAKCDDGKTWSSHGTSLTDTMDYTKDFHIYSVEWDAYQITWKVDGKIKKVVYGLKRFRLNRPVDENKIKTGRKYRLYQVMPDEKIGMSIIVSCNVTNYGNGLKPLNRGEYPKIFEVDYVRAYAKERK